MPTRNSLENASLYGMSKLPVSIRLPITAAQILNGTEVDFDLMLNDAIQAGCMTNSIKVAYHYRYIVINTDIYFSTYSKVHDFLNHMERSANEIGRTAGLIIAHYLKAEVFPLSGVLASRSDSRTSASIETEMRHGQK